MTKFLLLDGARMGEQINKAKALNAFFSCIYDAKDELIFQKIGPYLFRMENQPAFEQWYRQHGWGDSWGIILETSASMEQLKHHFMKYKMVKDKQGKPVYFRYYDPRVLKMVLPTFDKKQLEDFFGPVDHFLIEGNSGEEAIKFWLQNGVIKQQVIGRPVVKSPIPRQ